MKSTWSKVYSGPGYPIDPKRYKALADAVSEMLDAVVGNLVLGLPVYAEPPKPKCNCPVCLEDEYLFRHKYRREMIQTEDFQSRLMEIQVKERQSG